MVICSRPLTFFKISAFENLDRWFWKTVIEDEGLQLYQKRDSSTNVFLWILWNFYLWNSSERVLHDHVKIIFNSARGVSKIHDGEDLWQWSRLEIRLNAFCWSTMLQRQFIIIIIIIIIIIVISSNGLCLSYCSDYANDKA